MARQEWGTGGRRSAGGRHGVGRALPLLALLLGLLVSPVPPAPPAEAAETATSWAIVTGGDPQGTFPSGLTATFDFNNGTQGAIGARTILADIGGSASLNPTGSRPGFQMPTFTNSDVTGTAFQNVGTVAINFSRPVRNPRLHGVTWVLTNGNASGLVNTELQLRITSGNATFTNLTMAPYYTVGATTLTPVGTTPVSFAGSVQLTGTFSSVTLAIDKRYRRLSGTAGGPTEPLNTNIGITVDEDLAGGATAIPASYGTAGHVLSNVSLGGNVTADMAGTITSGAAAPAQATDTNDANPAFPPLSFASRGSPYTVPVPVTGLAGASGPATLSGWIDFNRNGTFDAGERAQASVTVGPGAGTINLTWPSVPADTISGPTWARLRYSYNSTQVAAPTGRADSGEVEDYALTILPAPPTITAPANGSVTIDNTPTISGTAEPNTTVAVTTSTGAAVCSATVSGAGTWTCTPAAAFPDGPVVISGTTTSPGGTSGPGNQVTFTVDTTAELEASKTAAPPADGTLNPGEQFTYTVGVTNNGPAAAANAVVTDSLPAPLTFVSSPDGCTASGQAVSCGPVASLAAGASASFDVVVALDPAYAGDGSDLANTAAVTSETGDNVPGNNTSPPVPPPNFGGPSTDLSITKTAPAAITAGENAAWQLSVTNGGPSTATGVEITDTMPAGLTFVSATPDICTAAGQTVTCAVGTLAPAASTSVPLVTAVAAGVPAGAVLTNTASVAAATADPVPGNDTATADGPPAAAVADVSISKTAPATVTAGENAAWTITVDNAGPSVASGVVISDTLPDGTTFVSSSPAVCSADGQAVTCNVGSVEAGSPATIALTTAVAASVAPGTVLTNTATVATTSTDPDPADDTASADSPPVGTSADLSIVKTPPTVVTPGLNAVWRITIVNNGPSDATGVVLTDTMGDGMSFVSFGPASCSAAGQVVTCPIGALPAGGVITGDFTVLVAASVPVGESILNTATATADTTDPNAANNTASDVIAPPGAAVADLSIAKDAPTTVTAGTEAVWTVTVTNGGPSDAAGVVVTDTLPAGASFVSSTPACTADGQEVTCPIGTVPAAAVTTISLTTAVAATVPAGTLLTNTATVASPTDDPDPADNTAAATSPPVTASADLSITKTPPAAILPGTDAVWTVTVANGGPSDAQDVVVTDLLDPGLTLASSSGDACTADGLVVTCELGTIAAGAEVVIELTTAVAADVPAGTVLTNAAAVESATADPDPGNNVTPNVEAPAAVASADLAITKVAPASVVPGTDSTWTITVTNNGPSDAQDVTVSDTLDPNLTLVSSSPAICSAAGQEVTCVLGAVPAGGTVEIGVTASAPASVPAGTVLENTATVASGTPDPEPANDTATATATAAPSADVAVTKVAPTTVVPGTDAVWTITVTNEGPSDAVGVVVTDTLEPGLTFVSSSPAICTAAGQEITCPVGTVAAGSEVVIALTTAVAADVPAGTVLTNTATLASDTPDPDPADNATPPVPAPPAAPSADVAVTKTPPASVVPGTEATWTITVTNNGPSDAQDVAVTDTLDPSLTFVSSDPAICLATGQVVTCDVGTLASGASATITLTTAVAVGVPAGTEIVNAASVTSGTPDPDPANDVTPPVPAPPAEPSADLAVVKGGPASVVPGTEATWLITVTNNGPSDATGVVVTDTLGPSTTFVSADPRCDAAGQVVTCDLGVLADGAAVSFEITVLVDPALPVGERIADQAAVTADTDDPVADNNTAEALAAPATPDADVAITKSAPVSVTAGTRVTWTMQVINNGPSQATDVSVTDTLDSNLTFVSSTPPCAAAGQVLTCDVGDLAAAGVVTIDLITDVAASVPAGTVIANTASVDAVTPDPNETDNTATATAPPVTTAADVSVTKTAPASIVPGTDATWTITVSNAGPSDAQAVTVTDTLDPNLTFVSSSPGICSAAGQAVTCVVGTVPPGVQITIGLTTSVSGALPDGTVLTNAASITSGTPDPDPADNTTPDVAAPPAGAAADMAISKAAPASVVPGTDATWTITVTNNGPSDAQAVTVTDTLDPNLTFVSSSPAICSAAGQAVTCAPGTLVAGSSVTISLTTRVAPGTAAGTVLTNAATVASPTPDPNAANNVSDVAAPAAAPSADLAVVKGGPGAIVPGTEATWLVTVMNNGPSDAQEVMIVDTLGDGTTFVSSDPPICTATGQQVRCDAGTMTAGATTSVEITVDVDQALPAGAVITNEVVVGSSAPDPNPADNTAEAQAAPATPDADLTVTKSAPASIAAGGTATWTIQVVNNGPSQALDVVVTDTLDPDLTFVSATPPCAAAGQDVTCDLGDLAAAQAVTIDIVTAVPPDVAAGTVIANTAEASTDTNDPNTADNTATATAPPVTSSADMVMEKTPPAALVPGTNAVWTITVTNGGPADALDVVVTDALDPSLTFVSSAPAICAAAGQAVTCSVGTVAAGGGTVIELTTAVAPNVPAGAVLTNAAAVQASTPDPDPADNATGDVAGPGAAPSADLRILKVPPGEVVPGQETPWRLTVVNLGPSDAVGVTIQDTLGAGTTFAASDPATCTAAGQDVTCDVGVVAAGAAASVTVTVLVDAALPEGSTISNSATVSATTADPLPANNATGLVAAPATPNADLSVTKTAPSSMVAGANATWTIQVVNAGPSQAVGVVVTDTLDPNLTFVSSTPAVCTAAGQNVTCDLGDLPAAGVQTIEITAMVAPSVAPGTVITNAAAVESATNDPNPLDNAPAPTSGPPVTAAADLSVTKAPPSELVAGAESAWTITVTNDGPSEARDVVASDTLDPALSFASSAPPICTATGQGVTCNVGTLGAGVSTSVVVSTVVAADSPAGTVITNSAGVASSTPDPDPVDNLAPPIAGEVEAQADAAIDVDIAPEQVRQGAELTIDVTVANDGPSAAVDAGALFALGEHLRLIRDNGGFSAPAPAQALGSGVRPAGEPCASSGATLRCAAANLLAGETARAAITVRVGTAVPIGTRITLRANLTVGTADGNTTNNSDQDSVVIVAALAQPTPTTSPPTTSPPTTSPPAQPATPFTGLEVTGLLVAAVVLLGLGTAAMAGARRRRAQSV